VGRGGASFADFYRVYPRKAEPRRAEAEWEKALNRGVTPEQMIAGAERYRDDPNRDPAFTKHASTWLHGDCWADEALPSRGNGSGNGRTYVQLVPPPPLTSEEQAAADEARKAAFDSFHGRKGVS
jgi:hypothetical protein